MEKTGILPSGHVLYVTIYDNKIYLEAYEADHDESEG
jgi:hypothetical protein